jgi:CheY-like chemotaxis protein
MKQHRILIVDDEAPTRLLLEKILLAAGYLVTSAHNGQTALKVSRAVVPDLVVCDLTMPGIDGFSLCSMFKRDGNFRAPILVLSGRVREKDKQEALDTGADAFLSKPVNREALLAKVAELLTPKPTTPQASPV